MNTEAASVGGLFHFIRYASVAGVPRILGVVPFEPTARNATGRRQPADAVVTDRNIQQYTASTHPLEATMLFSRFTQSAVVIALLTVGLAAPAHAQNNKQIISGTWYEDRAFLASNSTSGSFTLNFAQTPTNQFLNVTNVSCDIQMTSNQILGHMDLSGGTTSGATTLAGLMP
jgi:hypothetical protein